VLSAAVLRRSLPNKACFSLALGVSRMVSPLRSVCGTRGLRVPTGRGTTRPRPETGSGCRSPCRTTMAGLLPPAALPRCHTTVIVKHTTAPSGKGSVEDRESETRRFSETARPLRLPRLRAATLQSSACSTVAPKPPVVLARCPTSRAQRTNNVKVGLRRLSDTSVEGPVELVERVRRACSACRERSSVVARGCSPDVPRVRRASGRAETCGRVRRGRPLRTSASLLPAAGVRVPASGVSGHPAA
jgi:hypothetical protein